jgi:hypothetical protein
VVKLLLVVSVGWLSAVAAVAAAADLLWEQDYGKARQAALDKKKPLAVFVGSGPGDMQTVATEGQFSPAINAILAEKYVCAYLDAIDSSQRDLINTFAITKGHGVVLSDRAGTYQAYHHDGRLSQAELARNLRVVSGTPEETQVTRISQYSPARSGSARSRSKPLPPLKKC